VNINSDYINSLTRVGFNESHGEALVEEGVVGFNEKPLLKTRAWILRRYLLRPWTR
jgi:hypothetical protein